MAVVFTVADGLSRFRLIAGGDDESVGDVGVFLDGDPDIGGNVLGPWNFLLNSGNLRDTRDGVLVPNGQINFMESLSYPKPQVNLWLRMPQIRPCLWTIS